MVSIGRMTILVRDLDEAKAFYRDAFGFATLFDGEVAAGLRTVHVGPHGERGAGLWLLEATTPASLDRVGAQTGGEPALVFYTDDLAGELRRLESLAVRVVSPLAGGDGASFVHVLDNSGNEIVLAQLPDEGRPSAYALIEA
jgi:catechol 2,3-dioxygenase-like lactoylglutathione lyase family enzyme